MKLVAERGREDSDKIIRVDWQDPELNWLSVWWEPTEEDYVYKLGKRNGYRGGEYGFPELASSFIPDSSIVYAELFSTFGERPDIIERLEEHGFRYEIPSWRRRAGWKPEKAERKSWYKVLFKRRSRDGAVYAEADRDFVAYAFKNYSYWMCDCWTFLVSRKPLADWAQKLDQTVRKRGITKELLTQIDLFLRNRWDHGFELLSYNVSYGQLADMAKEASAKLKWQLEIRVRETSSQP